MAIAIPSTLDQAGECLAQIESVVTAKGWERAAIVWAFTLQGDDHVGENTHKISFRAFAAKGFAGLREHHAVARYHDAWQQAINDGHAKQVQPGDRVEIPNLAWPYPSRYEQEHLTPERRKAIEAVVGAGGPAVGSVARVIDQPSAVAAAIRANPELAVVAEQAVRDRRHEHPEDVVSTERPEPPSGLGWMTALVRAIRELDRLVAMGSGQGPFNDEGTSMIDEAAHRLETAASWLRTFARNESISDETLHAWLGEGVSDE